jgi:hypothetical protein
MKRFLLFCVFRLKDPERQRNYFKLFRNDEMMKKKIINNKERKKLFIVGKNGGV